MVVWGHIRRFINGYTYTHTYKNIYTHENFISKYLMEKKLKHLIVSSVGKDRKQREFIYTAGGTPLWKITWHYLVKV